MKRRLSQWEVIMAPPVCSTGIFKEFIQAQKEGIPNPGRNPTANRKGKTLSQKKSNPHKIVECFNCKKKNHIAKIVGSKIQPTQPNSKVILQL
jgi:hypothetical protein